MKRDKMKLKLAFFLVLAAAVGVLAPPAYATFWGECAHGCGEHSLQTYGSIEARTVTLCTANGEPPYCNPEVGADAKATIMTIQCPFVVHVDTQEGYDGDNAYAAVTAWLDSPYNPVAYAIIERDGYTGLVLNGNADSQVGCIYAFTNEFE